MLKGWRHGEEKTYAMPLAYEDSSSILFRKPSAKGTLHVSVRGAITITHLGIICVLYMASLHACVVVGAIAKDFAKATKQPTMEEVVLPKQTKSVPDTEGKVEPPVDNLAKSCSSNRAAQHVPTLSKTLEHEQTIQELRVALESTRTFWQGIALMISLMAVLGIAAVLLFGPAQCEAVDTAQCEPCPSSWAPWGPCTRSCGGGRRVKEIGAGSMFVYCHHTTRPFFLFISNSVGSN